VVEDPVGDGGVGVGWAEGKSNEESGCTTCGAGADAGLVGGDGEGLHEGVILGEVVEAAEDVL